MKQTTSLFLKIGIMVILLLNMKYGNISFDSPRINYLVIAFALVLPWFMSPVAFKGKISLISNKFVVLILKLFSILGLIVWSFFAFIYSGAIIHDEDYSFEKINNITIKNNNYGVYRTNGGAMTAFGIVVQKETYILPFLKYATVVYSNYPASELKNYKELNGKIIFESK